jgi:hypothetical protein
LYGLVQNVSTSISGKSKVVISGQIEGLFEKWVMAEKFDFLKAASP